MSQYDLMAKLALAYGRALRLTPKADRVSTADGRDPRRSNYQRPWEDDARARRPKPWDD